MKFEQILQLIKDLSKSQGFYRRLLSHINELSKTELKELKKSLEEENFKSPIDFILYMEG